MKDGFIEIKRTPDEQAEYFFKIHVKEYLRNNTVLISYLYDNMGGRCGVVVATGKNKVGWSLVHPYDYIQKAEESDGATLYWKEPKFKKYTGIAKAIDRALNPQHWEYKPIPRRIAKEVDLMLSQSRVHFDKQWYQE